VDELRCRVPLRNRAILTACSSPRADIPSGSQATLLQLQFRAWPAQRGGQGTWLIEPGGADRPAGHLVERSEHHVLTLQQLQRFYGHRQGRAEEIGASLAVVVAEPEGQLLDLPVDSSFSSKAQGLLRRLGGFQVAAKQSPMAWIDDAAPASPGATPRSSVARRAAGQRPAPGVATGRHLANR